LGRVHSRAFRAEQAEQAEQEERYHLQQDRAPSTARRPGGILAECRRSQIRNGPLNSPAHRNFYRDDERDAARQKATTR
jgi:hypothetical protein